MLIIIRVATIAMLAVFLGGCLNGGSHSLDATSGVLTQNAPIPEINDSATITDATLSRNSVSSSFEEQLDASDLPRLKQAQLTAFQQQRGGAPIAWHNPDTKHSGQVTSGPTYTINGRKCRDFIHIITIDGAQQSENGVACRQADGAWQAIPE